MSKHGELTAEIGKSLKLEGYDVFYDHGEPSPSVGKIVSSIDKAPAMGEELSQLDIAIIKKTTNKAVALIEIEETTDTPKTFLGDIFGILRNSGKVVQKCRTQCVKGATPITINRPTASCTCAVLNFWHAASAKSCSARSANAANVTVTWSVA